MSGGISLHVDIAPLLALATRLRGADNKIATAIRQGLNEGGDLVRTDVRRALQKVTGLRTYRSVTSRTRSTKATEGSLRYTIIGSGKGIPIREFTTKGTLGPGGGVTSNPWATLHMFKRSFVGTGRIAGQFRARLPGPKVERTISGGKRGTRKVKVSAIRALYGPSIPKEMLQGPVPGLFLISTGAQVPPAIIKRMSRALIG